MDISSIEGESHNLNPQLLGEQIQNVGQRARMPFTPFHGLALMFLHFRYEKRMGLLAVLASATFVDFEPLYYMSVGESIDHRIWHSIPMSLTVYPVLITL